MNKLNELTGRKGIFMTIRTVVIMVLILIGISIFIYIAFKTRHMGEGVMSGIKNTIADLFTGG